MNGSSSGSGDLYELLTVFLIAAVSAIVMVAWLKRRGKKKRQNGGG